MQTRSNLLNLKFEPLEFSESQSDTDKSLSVTSEQMDQALDYHKKDVSNAHRMMPIRLLSDQEPPEYPVPPTWLIPEVPEPEVPLEMDDSDSDQEGSTKKKSKKAKKKAKKREKKERKRKRKEKKRRKKLEESQMYDPTMYKHEVEKFEQAQQDFIKDFIKEKLEKAHEGAISMKAVTETLEKDDIRAVRNEIMCPICQDMINDPVFLKTWSHRFWKECIETHIRVR